VSFVNTKKIPLVKESIEDSKKVDFGDRWKHWLIGCDSEKTVINRA